MLCKFCEDFDYDQMLSGGYPHHPSYAHLRASAMKGCEICRLVLTNRDWDPYSATEKNYTETQLYCKLAPDLGDLTWETDVNFAGFMPCTTASE
jgi:hypothetical protein